MQQHKLELADGRHLIIREAKRDDTRTVIEYLETTYAETDFLTFEAEEFEKEEERIENIKTSENQLCILAILDGEIVGLLSFSAKTRPHVNHTGELGMSVCRTYWGQGVGSKMLDVLIAWAKSTGIISKLNLRVRTDNERALQLYRRKGFVIEGTISREMCLAGQYFDQHWMGLQL